MPSAVRRFIRWCLRQRGYDVIPFDPEKDFADQDLRDEDAELGILSQVGPYTMTSRANVSAMCRAVEYVVRTELAGAIVECGVWKGGSMMAAALRLLQLDAADRDLFLFDTYEGMVAPGERDRDRLGRQPAPETMTGVRDDRWCYCPVDEVRRNLQSTAYPRDRMYFIKGPVESTIPEHAPDQIAILRLDTDWYESTRHELEYLYPRLVRGGVLIIDDYGYWQGAQQAVDEYIRQHSLRLLLQRIDHSARICVKLDD